MTKNYRFGFATILAPLAVPLLILVFSVLGSGFTYEEIRQLDSGILFAATFVSYSGVLLIGLPAVYWLHYSKLLSLRSLGIAGAVGGVAVVFVIRAVFGGASSLTLTIEMVGPVLFFAGLGMMVSIVFGLLAKV